MVRKLKMVWVGCDWEVQSPFFGLYTWLLADSMGLIWTPGWSFVQPVKGHSLLFQVLKMTPVVPAWKESQPIRLRGSEPLWDGRKNLWKTNTFAYALRCEASTKEPKWPPGSAGAQHAPHRQTKCWRRGARIGYRLTPSGTLKKKTCWRNY